MFTVELCRLRQIIMANWTGASRRLQLIMTGAFSITLKNNIKMVFFQHFILKLCHGIYSRTPILSTLDFGNTPILSTFSFFTIFYYIETGVFGNIFGVKPRICQHFFNIVKKIWVKMQYLVHFFLFNCILNQT